MFISNIKIIFKKFIIKIIILCISFMGFLLLNEKFEIFKENNFSEILKMSFKKENNNIENLNTADKYTDEFINQVLKEIPFEEIDIYLDKYGIFDGKIITDLEKI